MRTTHHRVWLTVLGLPLFVGLSGPAWADEAQDALNASDVVLGDVSPSAEAAAPLEEDVVRPMDPPPPPAAKEALPEGKTPIWDTLPKPRGYVRAEMRHHRPNLHYAWDPRSDAWLAHGSPYLVYDFIPYALNEGYVEVNTEVKYAPNYVFTAYADLSFFYQTLGPATSTFEDMAYQAGAATGEAVELGFNEMPPSEYIKWENERLQINELYANGYVGDHLILLAGKRRTYWGNSFTWTPLDLVNPASSSTEPTLQREGAFSALADVTFDRFTVSFLYAPFQMDNGHGLPTNWDFTKAKYVARLYLNPWYQDVNFVYMLNDDVIFNEARHQVGFSYSGYPVGDIEVHAEGIAQLGRTNYLVQRRAATGDMGEWEAPYEVGQLEIDDGKVYGDFLIGTRYNFEDNSLLMAEYLYRHGGYSGAEYNRYSEYLTYLETALPQLSSMVDPTTGGSEGESTESLDAVSTSWSDLLSETPYLLQDPFVRRHYLSLAYQKGWINDWISPSVNTILSLEDGSMILFPQVQIQMTDAVLLQTGGMVVIAPDGAQGGLFPDEMLFNLRMTAKY